jgi:hypothetical protein
MPFRRGIEVEKIPWKEVQAGLDAAKKAGVRPPQPPPRIAKSRAWVNAQLEGTGITLTARRYPGPEWVAEYQCAKGHVLTEYTTEVVARKSCPCCVDWDWAEGYWGKGLRASLRELEHQLPTSRRLDGAGRLSHRSAGTQRRDRHAAG